MVESPKQQEPPVTDDGIDAASSVEDTRWDTELRYRKLTEATAVLVQERDRGWLRERFLRAAVDLAAADGGVFFEVRDQHVEPSLLYYPVINLEPTEPKGQKLADILAEGMPANGVISDPATDRWIIRRAADNGTTERIVDINAADELELGEMDAFERASGFATRAMLVVPLVDFEQQVSGVVQLVKGVDAVDEGPDPFDPKLVEILESLATIGAGCMAGLDMFDQAITTGIDLASERDPMVLLERIVLEAKRLSNADGGIVYLRDDQNRLRLSIMHSDAKGLVVGRTGTIGSGLLLDPDAASHYLSDAPEISESGDEIWSTVAAAAAHRGSALHVPHLNATDEYRAADTRTLDTLLGCRTTSVFAVPLINRKGHCVGVVQLVNAHDSVTGTIVRFRRHVQSLVQGLAAQASVAIDNQGVYQQLIETGISLSAEHDHDRLLEKILLEAKDICNAEGGTLYLVDGDKLAFSTVHNETLGIAMGGATGVPITFEPLPLYDAETGAPNHANVATHVALTGDIVNIDDAYETADFDFSGTRAFDDQTGYRSCSFITVPLKDRDGGVIGVLQLINACDWQSGEVVPFSSVTQPLVESLTSQAAVALNNQQLIESQRALLDSFIELMAQAIDSKSPYTGGHCQRVPELARLLASETCATTDAPFADFDLNEEEWYELNIASLLHDCGKVTTPEYVVDKSTKLEIIYNRIHEIRMRFEVAKRDAEIEYLKAKAAGKADVKTLERGFEDTIAALNEDFEFVAECNVGGEFMAVEKIDRLKVIAKRTWVRTLNDRVGLSNREVEELAPFAPRPAPQVEQILADRAEHIVPRDTVHGSIDVERYGIAMDIPKAKANYGEIYNLSIPRGTLTDEERYKINEHIILTIVMLEQLPFPRHLKRVPEYAGGHHEKLDGRGYPRGLTKAQMSVPARIMAIADIFEALTASDRPYKKANSLSQAITIMGNMVAENHLDPDLFALFLRTGVHTRYAENFLQPEQLDEVDIEQYLAH